MSVKFKSTKVESLSIENATAVMRTYLIGRGLSELNIRNRVNAAKYIMKKYGRTRMSEPFLEQVKVDMIKEGRKPSYTNYVLFSLEYLAASQKVKLKVDKLPITEYRKDWLTPEQARSLLSATDNVRDFAIVHLMLGAGLRVKEIVNCNTRDYDSAKRILHIRDNRDVDIPYKGIKNGMEDIVVLSKETARALDEYLDDRPIVPTSAMFITQYGKRIHARSVENIVTKAAEDAGLDRRVYPHLLRHTMITLMCKSNINLALIAKQARHGRDGSDIRMTMRYAHPSDDMLRQAIDAVPIF